MKVISEKSKDCKKIIGKCFDVLGKLVAYFHEVGELQIKNKIDFTCISILHMENENQTFMSA